jgi:hypothetical protein
VLHETFRRDVHGTIPKTERVPTIIGSLRMPLLLLAVPFVPAMMVDGKLGWREGAQTDDVLIFYQLLVDHLICLQSILCYDVQWVGAGANWCACDRLEGETVCSRRLHAYARKCSLGLRVCI